MNVGANHATQTATGPANNVRSSRTTLDALLLEFADADPDAYGWKYLFPDESEWESPDCDVMSERFLHLAQARGYTGHLIRADSEAEGEHWFAVVRAPGSDAEYAVDWTAKQFYNVNWPPDDPDGIPCPLVFKWDGSYPLDVIEFESIGKSEAPYRTM